MNRFYFYKNAKRVGPINSAQLRKLALAGLINRDTVIETDTGRQVNASRVYGLVFKSEPDGVKSRSVPHGIPVVFSANAVPLAPNGVINFSAPENTAPHFSTVPDQKSESSLSHVSPVQSNSRRSFIFSRPNPQSVFDVEPDQNVENSSEPDDLFSSLPISSKGIIVVK